ncbi:MAG: hypothetical protein O9302_06295 [Cyclobacteriaceae bacterium]|jgi:hypothetical protein|nr:hypothetical protein [Cytophagales bacterium]MCZ8327648.1 hypothetical protein [Cyclobacteriaceae bacterium]
MFNYYLFNPSYENAASNVLEDNLQTLQSIFSQRDDNETFLKHDSIWDVAVADGTFAEVVFSRFQDKQFSIQVLPQLLQQITSVEPAINTLEEFNHRYRIYNAFYGINFQGAPPESCIGDLASYNTFIENNNWELTPDTFWERREELFNRVVLCANVEAQIQTIGGTYLEQIIDKIRELDNYVLNHWNEGSFNFRNANKKTALIISPESHSTMQQKDLVNLRTFSLPDGRRECFELHIKTGNLRFHFYPENFMVYIGYIGYHLPTSRH